MEFRVLRYFMAVVREGSITKAADILHISQPTLSRQLQDLEAQLGVRLFERGKRKISLTNDGLLLYRRGEEIIELMDKTEHELSHATESIQGVVTIGCGDLSAIHLLSEVMNSFSRQYPLVSFDLCTGEGEWIKDRMEHGLIDIGILLEPIDLNKYDYIRLHHHERWVVMMHPQSPLANQAYINAKDLEDKPLILPRRASIQDELKRWFGHGFEHSNVVVTSNLTSTSAILVQHQLGYAIVIEGSVASWDDQKVVCRPLYPNLIATSVIAWKRDHPFAQATNQFIEWCKSQLIDGQL